jgi:hypothetical protein
MAAPVVDVPVVALETTRSFLVISATLLPGMVASGVRTHLRPYKGSPSPATVVAIICVYSALALAIGETLAELWGSFGHGLIHGDLARPQVEYFVRRVGESAVMVSPQPRTGFGDYMISEMRGPYYEGPALWAWPRVALLMLIGAVLPLVELGHSHRASAGAK